MKRRTKQNLKEIKNSKQIKYLKPPSQQNIGQSDPLCGPTLETEESDTKSRFCLLFSKMLTRTNSSGDTATNTTNREKITSGGINGHIILIKLFCNPSIFVNISTV